MKTNKMLYVCMLSFQATLFLVSFISQKIVQNFFLAFFISAATVIISFFLKKRDVHDFHKREVAFVMLAVAVIMIAIFLLTGIKFGFINTPFNAINLVNSILPIGIVVIAMETLRSIFIAQKSKFITIASFFAFFWIDFLILCDTNPLANYNSFMLALGFALLPALTSNFLYHYISSKFGATANIVYKLIILLFPYVLPYKPNMSDVLVSFLRIIIPIGIYLLIHLLYTPRTFVIAKRNKLLQVVLTTIAVVFSITYIMLVSLQFEYKLIVVATRSMSGEIDMGDAVIYQEYDGSIISQGDVIVFKRDNSRIIHRVIDIKKINGQLRYFTKGDANDSMDSGYITDADVLGVVNLKIKYVGYPTLWLRSLFE